MSLFGATSNNHGMFSVAMDGGADVVLNGTSPEFRPDTVLVSASTFGSARSMHAHILNSIAGTDFRMATMFSQSRTWIRTT
jgi:hypothetical protein